MEVLGVVFSPNFTVWPKSAKTHPNTCCRIGLKNSNVCFILHDNHFKNQSKHVVTSAGLHQDFVRKKQNKLEVETKQETTKEQR